MKRSSRLGDLELAVLGHLWTAGEADVSETHAAVGKARKITPNTVGSAMERLHRKGLVLRDKVSHAYRYRPALTEDEYTARKVLQATEGVGLARAGLLSAFVDLVAEADEEALERLQKLIAKKKKERKQ